MNISEEVAIDENISVVKQFFKYYEDGDIIGMRSILDPEIQWIVLGHHPLGGIKKGIEEVIAYYKQLQKVNFRAEVQILQANNEYAIDCHREWADYNGHKIDMNWVLLYKIKNGKILSIQNFPADQYSVDNFFWKVYKLKNIPYRLDI